MIQIEEVSYGFGPRHELRVLHGRRRRHLGVTSVQHLAGDVVGSRVAGQLADEGLVPRELLQRAARAGGGLSGAACPGGRRGLAGGGGGHASEEQAAERVARGRGRRQAETARGEGAGEEEVGV